MSESPVEYIELNLSNYDADDVSRLNEWAMWAVGEIERLRAREPYVQHLPGCKRDVFCRSCNGTGRATTSIFDDASRNPCLRCNGTGSFVEVPCTCGLDQLKGA